MSTGSECVKIISCNPFTYSLNSTCSSLLFENLSTFYSYLGCQVNLPVSYMYMYILFYNVAPLILVPQLYGTAVFTRALADYM